MYDIKLFFFNLFGLLNLFNLLLLKSMLISLKGPTKVRQVNRKLLRLGFDIPLGPFQISRDSTGNMYNIKLF